MVYRVMACRYNYSKIQAAMAEKAAAAASPPTDEEKPLVQLSANGNSNGGHSSSR